MGPKTAHGPEWNRSLSLKLWENFMVIKRTYIVFFVNSPFNLLLIWFKIMQNCLKQKINLLIKLIHNCFLKKQVDVSTDAATALMDSAGMENHFIGLRVQRWKENRGNYRRDNKMILYILCLCHISKSIVSTAFLQIWF